MDFVISTVVIYGFRKVTEKVNSESITDNTEQILVNNRIPHINLIHNLGIGGAVQTGYKYALKNNYDIAVQFDGDGQHDINYVKRRNK